MDHAGEIRRTVMDFTWSVPLGFSAGVEVGHQVVVLPTFGALKLARGWRSGTAVKARALLLSRSGSAAIALAGIFYFGAALRWW